MGVDSVRRWLDYVQCDQIGQFIWHWATFQRLWQQLVWPNLPHSKAIFVKVSISLIFLVKSFLGNFYRHLATVYWSHWDYLPIFCHDCLSKECGLCSIKFCKWKFAQTYRMYIQMVGILGRSPLSYRYPPCPSASKCKSSSFQMNQLGITSVPFKLPRYKKYLLAHCFPFQSQFSLAEFLRMPLLVLVVV